MAAASNITALTAATGTGSPFSAWIARQRARGKSVEAISRYVAKVWLDFAWNAVKTKLPPADKARIRRELMTIVSTYTRLQYTKTGKIRRLSKTESRYRGTLAERVVGALNYKNFRTARGTARAAIVGKFVNARAFAARHHIAAFLPSYKFLKANPIERSGPRYQKHPAGGAEGTFKDSLAEILMWNSASSAPAPHRAAGDGIAALVPGAFEDKLPEVLALLGQLAIKDAIKDGIAAAGSVFTFQQ